MASSSDSWPPEEPESAPPGNVVLLQPRSGPATATLVPPSPVPSSDGPDSEPNPFGDVFGVPVGDEAGATAAPSTAAPMISADFSMDIEDEGDDEEDPDDVPTPSSSRPAPALDDDQSGFHLPRMESSTPVVPLARPSPPPPPNIDFGFLLNGYACYVEHERVVFGRPYGTRLIDLHSYDTQSNLDRGYQAFLRDKIREGFIPQTEMVGELPRGVTVMPLDSERLATAWRAIT
jgi:hypothetical protein